MDSFAMPSEPPSGRSEIKYRALKPSCANCDNGVPEIMETRPANFHGHAAVLRRRKCNYCGHKSRTFEIDDKALDSIVADRMAWLKSRILAALSTTTVVKKRRPK